MTLKVISTIVLAGFYFFISPQIVAGDLTVSVLDKESKPLNDIVVYVVSQDGRYPSEKQSREITIYQEGQKFAPYLTVKSTQDTLIFENKDNITHHVYTVLSRDLDFRLKEGQVKRDEETKIDSAGKTLMGCNIHDWMIGYVFTVETPHFGKTNSAGEVTFSLVDDKNYRVHIWHPQITEKDNQLSSDVKSGHAMKVTLQLTEAMAEIPTQEGEALFEFLDDYE